MKSIFITGISGSGKSRLSKELRELGQEAFDFELDEYGLFMFVRKDTGERYMDYDNTDMAKVNNAVWVCDVEKLKKLLNQQKTKIAFYCGAAGNNLEIKDLFDTCFLLRADPAILEKRLYEREGTDDFANTAEGRKLVLEMKKGFEEEMLQAGMLPIDANQSSRQVAELITELARK
jgi:broad-specificity NMP kinase